MAILAIFTSVLGPVKVGDGVGQTLQKPTALLIIFTRSDHGARVGAMNLVASL